MKHLQTEATELQAQGYTLAEIAEELGITKNKVQSLLEVEKNLPTTLPPAKSPMRKLGYATEKLKDSFDALVEQIQKLDGEDLDHENSHELLEQCRKLEFQFRKVAQQFQLDYEQSEHWEALQDLVHTLKEPIQTLEDDEVFELDIEADLYSTLDDLRFEVIAWGE